MRDIIHNVPVRLRPRLLRPEIRRRALRAAAAVAVGAAAGCVTVDEPVTSAAHLSDATANDGQGGLDGVGGADAGRTQRPISTLASRAADASSGADTAAFDDAGAAATPDSGGAADSGAADSGAADSGGGADAGSQSDATADAGPAQVVTTGSVCRQEAGWESYSRCCQANGWDWNKGCMAWGPPAPPEVDEAWMAALIHGLTDEVTA